MSLSKKAKIWIAVLSTPIIILIIAIIGLKLYLTGDRLKTLIIPPIEEATHRTVTVEDISFSVFPSFAVSIDKLSISNPPGKKFARETFLSFNNLRLKVNLFSLLKDKLEINYIIIDHPVISMEVLADGSNNYSMTEKKSPDGKVQVVKNSGGALLLSNLQIINGEMEFINKKSDIRFVMSGMEQSSEVTSQYGARNIVIEGKTSIQKVSYGTMNLWLLIDQPLDGNIKMTYEIDKDILIFDDVKAKLKELPVIVSGSISQLQKEEMIFDMTVSTPGTGMNQLLSLVPADLLKAAKGLSSSGEVKFSTSIKGTLGEMQTPGAAGSFTVKNGSIQYSGLPKSITKINVAGSFERPEVRAGEKPIGKFSLDNFSAALGTNEINGKLGVVNFEDPGLTASFNGMLNLGEVKEFYPLENGTDLSGTVLGNLQLDGKAKNPQSIKANGKIEFRNVSMKTVTSPQPVEKLNGAITFNNQLIESKRLEMNIGESDLSLGFVMKNYLAMVNEDAKKVGGKPTASITLASKQLRTADLISEEKPSAEKGNGNKKAETKVMFLPGVDIDANVSIGRLVTEKFEFTNARGSLNIKDGIINLKNFSINAFDGTVLTKGVLDLRDMKKRPFDFDLDIVGVQANSALSKFTSFGKNIFGKFTMNTKLKGDLNDTLGLNPQTLVGDGKVQIFDGKLQGFALTTKLSEATGLEELRQVDFKNWSNAFSISNGKVNIKDLKINSGAADFSMNGTHGLDGNMDYVLNIKLPASVSDRLKLSGVASQLVQLFKDKDNRVSLDFNVRGATTSPAVSLNTKTQEDMAKQALEKEKQKLLDEGKKKAGDELKKKAEEGLKKLFKKP
ncbi:MAG: AsmA family protein [Ignavibacteriales bacterium]|nr:AsmA family protein [Ignavibacteriales bacterium]